MLRAADILTGPDGAVKPLHPAPFAEHRAICAIDVAKATGTVTVTLRHGPGSAAVGAVVQAALEDLPQGASSRGRVPRRAGGAMMRAHLAIALAGLVGVLVACDRGPVRSAQSAASAPPAGADAGGRAPASPPTAVRATDDAVSATAATLRPVDFKWSTADRPAWQAETIAALREAAAALDDAYWRQMHPDGPERFHALEREQPGTALFRLIDFGGFWNRLGDHAPLLDGLGPRRPGANLYPEDLTATQWQSYLAAHPDQQAALVSPYTVVRRDGPRLVPVAYHVAFGDEVRRAAEALRRAAQAVHNQDFSRWLAGRATALETDDYRANDIEWVKLRGLPIEVVAGPHELDEDRLAGVKTVYQVAIGLVDDVLTARLQTYAALAGQIERQLPWQPPAGQDTSRVMASLVAAADVLRAGDALHSGYTLVATNLPNDPRVQQTFGTRKIFFTTAMQARVSAVIQPIAARLMDRAQLTDVTAEGYLHGTVLHEIAHALGPRTVRRGDRTVPLNEALRERYGTIEECKATVAGFTALPFLTERGLISPLLARQIYTTELAGIFRDVRLGEAHARASTLALDWYLQHGAVTVQRDGRFHAALDVWPGAVRGLAKELLAIEAAGDYDAAGAFIERYGHFTPEVQAAIGRVSDVPTEVYPVFVETGAAGSGPTGRPATR